jgi:hypothetical protein
MGKTIGENKKSIYHLLMILVDDTSIAIYKLMLLSQYYPASYIHFFYFIDYSFFVLITV